MKDKVKIIVADDHPIFREGLVNILSKEKCFSISNVAGDGNKAMQMIRDDKPDVAILDISMPGLSGIDISKIILEEELPTSTIILTMYSEEEYLDEALENDVKGYLLKDSTSTEIVECINTILNGGYYISKQLTDHIIKNKRKKKSDNDILQKFNSLTPTEKQVLKLLSENKTSTQIAKEMFISYRTVQNHRINITHKLNLTGHNSLLLFAIENKKIF